MKAERYLNVRIRQIDIQQIIRILGMEVISVYGLVDCQIDNLADANHTNERTLDWINSNNENKQEATESSVAKVILTDDTVHYSDILKKQGKTVIVVKDPKRALAIVGNEFFVDTFTPGIHSSCIIDPDAEIADDVSIAPFVQIGKARIGKGTVISANVRIYDDVVIGDYCFIKEGAVIGGQGYGYEIDNEGNRFRFPQIGGVIIGNHVDIGGNTCIDRGALSDTIIEDYAKIDNLCHVAHNVHIGKNAMVIACSEVSGSCKIGENAWIGPNTSVRDWRNIGSNSTIGIGSNVVKDVPSNEVWAGNPAKKMR